jgi:hypothetical protein
MAIASFGSANEKVPRHFLREEMMERVMARILVLFVVMLLTITVETIRV